MSSTILSEKLTECKAEASEHNVAVTRCFNIGSGIDCEVVCSCSEVAFGFSERSKGEAYTRAIEHFEEHWHIVAKHTARCLSDVGLGVR